jgi:hypothetical protein
MSHCYVIHQSPIGTGLGFFKYKTLLYYPFVIVHGWQSPVYTLRTKK